MKKNKNKTQSYILFTPGPINLEKKVRTAATSKDLFHRQKEFIDILIKVKQNLLNISQKNNSYVSILHGSGSLAVESALQTLIQGNVLVINNGDYCERIKKSLIMKQDTTVKSLDLKMGEYPNLDTINDLLNKDEYNWICMVHHETTTGLLNPVKKICDIAQKKSIRVFVDAVSSFGAHEVDKRASVICTNSNKCLESIPGAAIIIWDKDINISNNIIPYINASLYIEDKIPFTLNTNAIIALNTALEIYLKEDRPKRYKKMAEYIRKKGSQYFDLFLKDNYSNVLTSFCTPEKQSFNICELMHKDGIILYPNKTLNSFRICNIGKSINYKTINYLFRKIERINLCQKK